MAGRLALVAVLLLAGCASAPPPPPIAALEGQAAVGIEVRIRPPLPIGQYAAETVFFARADSAGEPDLTALHVSSRAMEGRAYAVNLPPGRYVAVAAGFKLPGSSYLSYFPRDAIVATAVDARAGELALAGRYLLDSTVGVCPGKADALQLRVAEALQPAVPKCGILRMAVFETLKGPTILMGGMLYPLGAVSVHDGGVLKQGERDAAALEALAGAARQDLEGSGWKVPSPAATPR